MIDLAIASRIGAIGAKDAALILLNRCQCAEIANAAAGNISRSPAFGTLGRSPLLNVKGKFRRLDGLLFISEGLKRWSIYALRKHKFNKSLRLRITSLL